MASGPPQTEPAPARAGALTEQGFRKDIQGIRGLALVLVLACHAQLSFAEGGFVGLDVFYVLSGFLITGLLLQEAGRTGSVSLLRFYARRARRLLPLAFTVLVVILAGSLVLFDSLRSHEVSGDAIAAAVYIANWRFMAEAVDYFRFDDPAISPVQHYWSLSVEEQFYLLWPILLLAALALGRRRLGVRPVLWTAVGGVTLASFAYGVWFSHADPDRAYFSTLARMWQIGLGCVLALVLPAGLRLPRALAALLAGGGLVALIWATIAYPDDIPYPGWYALVPTLGAAAVIVAGTAVHASAPIRLLCTAPMQYLGRISYAYYLWHWPALVFAAAIWTDLTPLQNVLVTVAAWVPAIVSHHLIEEPFRHSKRLARRPRRAIAFGLTCTAAAVALALGLSGVQPSITTASADQVRGAEAVERDGPRIQRSAKRVRPHPRNAKTDWPKPFHDECHLRDDPRTTSPSCVYARRSSTTTVVNMGDSHGLQYFPTVHRIAKRRGWRLVNLTRAGCTVADVTAKRQCNEWRENSLRRIERARPALVVISHATTFGHPVHVNGRRVSERESWRHLEEGLVRTLRRIRATGARVIVIRDMPTAPRDVVHCVADNIDRLRRCAFRFNRSRKTEFDHRAAQRVEGARAVDPARQLCRRRRLCPAVIGDVLVYRNSYHLTATFARTLAPWLERRLPKTLR